MGLPGRSHWSSYLVAVVLVALGTGVGTLAHRHLAAPDLVMLYLLVIGVAAARLGRGPSLSASSLSVLAYDFFFVPPFHTLKVEDERHLLTFAMMFAVGLAIRHLTGRVRREAEQARSAALRAQNEETRSSLLSAVSHDLRTPLGAITGAATTLRDRGAHLEPEQRADLVDAICVEAERLDRLVRNLLDMTRLESGAVEVKRDWVPLDEIVGSALSRVEGELSGRPVKADVPADLPLVSVDPVLVEQVFVNLLENVARHTPPASGLDISAREQPGVVIIELADQGPGIPAGCEQRIFEKFFRGSGSSVAGAGLGLAVCRAIAAVHRGTLVAENRPLGGALFRLSLPWQSGPPSLPPGAEGDSGLDAVAQGGA